MLYCPRCDKRLTPDHRCVSRRIFLGMLGLGGSAVALAPTAPADTNLIMPGDLFAVNVTGGGGFTYASVTVEMEDGELRIVEADVDPCITGDKPFFISPGPCTIVSARVLSGGTVRDAKVTVMRSRR